MGNQVIEAANQIQHSIADLDKHNRSCGGDTADVELRHFVGSHSAGIVVINIEIWWINVPSSVANQFLWDVYRFEFESGVEVQNFLQQVAIVQPAINFKLALEQSSNSRGYGERLEHVPLFQYQPERFRAKFDFAKSVANSFSSLPPDFGAFGQDQLQSAMQAVLGGYNKELLVQPLRDRISGDTNRQVQSFAQLACFYGLYHHSGRQIFDFPLELSKMFRKTDIDDIPANLLKFPYACFYLHFGPQADLHLTPGWHPDGAYVAYSSKAQILQICLTAAPATRAVYDQWPTHSEPSYIQAINKERLGIGLGEATEQVLAAKMQSLRGASNRTCSDAALGDVIAELDLSDVRITDVSARNSLFELQKLPEQHATYLVMLRLVVNAIAYLSAYPDDAKALWPKSTPVGLLALTQEGTSKQQGRARSKLASLGFTPIHFCGQQFASNSDAASQCGITDKTVRTHWRRGFWRRQHHGAQNALIKLIWIMPVLVRAKDADELDVDGHVYLVT